MTNPIYQYSDTGVVEDGVELTHQDACKRLQCLQRKVSKLDDALFRKVDTAGWVCSKVKDELTMLRNYIGITPKSLLSDRQDMMKRVHRILGLFEDKPNDLD